MHFFNVSIDDVLFWMDAIRNSRDRDRVLESFWKGQVGSKIWLIENLKKYVEYPRGYRVAIYGGWNGVLANLLFNSGIGMDFITSLDIDPDCEEVASTINKVHEMRGTFRAVTADMCEYTVEDADIAINTSCEHITQEQYEKWLSNQPKGTLIILQSNNYKDLKEHVNCKDKLEEFENSCGLNIVWSGTLKLPKYDRYMIIGNKNETGS